MSENKWNNSQSSKNSSYQAALDNLSMTIEEVEAERNNPPAPDYPNLTKYGVLARDYMKQTNPSSYQVLLMDGMVMETFLEVERQADEMMETLQAQLRKQTPRPKTDDYLTLLQYETMIHDTAEEIVLAEIVYQKR